MWFSGSFVVHFTIKHYKHFIGMVCALMAGKAIRELRVQPKGGLNDGSQQFIQVFHNSLWKGSSSSPSLAASSGIKKNQAWIYTRNTWDYFEFGNPVIQSPHLSPLQRMKAQPLLSPLVGKVTNVSFQLCGLEFAVDCWYLPRGLANRHWENKLWQITLPVWNIDLEIDPWNKDPEI